MFGANIVYADDQTVEVTEDSYAERIALPTNALGDKLRVFMLRLRTRTTFRPLVKCLTPIGLDMATLERAL